MEGKKTIIYIPAYADGKELIAYQSDYLGQVDVTFAINPDITLDADGSYANAKAYLQYTADPLNRGTATGTLPADVDLTIVKIENVQTGYKFTLQGTLDEAFWLGDIGATICIDIDGSTSAMVPVVAHEYVAANISINDFENGENYQGKATE